MHTFVYGGVRFHYNLDLSGDVEIREHGLPDNAWGLKIPADALLAFVAEHIRNRKIAELEKASVNKIFGIEG